MKSNAQQSMPTTACCRTGGRVWSRSALISLPLISALTGCASGTVGTRDPPPISPALLVKAKTQLPPARSGKLPDLMANHKESAEQYQIVATRLNALIDEVTQPAAAPARWWQVWKRSWWQR